MYRRTYLPAALLLATTALTGSAFGAPPTAPAAASTSADSPAQMPDFDHMAPTDLYHYGTELLKHGLEFNRAIDVLGLAVKQDPKNLDYQLGLGCAYASRFASVGQAQRQAAAYGDAQKTYAQRQAAWEKAQSNPDDPEYNALPPTPPPMPATPDDRHRFRLSQDEAARTLTLLGRQSLAAFDAADKLAQSAPAEQRARAEYVRGWGLFLLRRYGKNLSGADRLDVVQDRAATGAAVVVKPEEIVACFRRATADAPQQPEYWHSLGLAAVPKYVDPLDNGNYLDYLQAFGNTVPAPADQNTTTAGLHPLYRTLRRVNSCW